jgi:hypothetical protein
LQKGDLTDVAKAHNSAGLPVSQGSYPVFRVLLSPVIAVAMALSSASIVAMRSG